MFSLLRLRAPLALALRVPRASIVPSVSLRSLALRTFATEPAAPRRGPRMMICPNCRREGHRLEECQQPLKCIACGEEGHIRKNCPNPDEERIKAAYAQPIKCFRCGGEHTMKECTEPAKCFVCGETGHIRRDCPSRPARAPAAEATPA